MIKNSEIKVGQMVYYIDEDTREMTEGTYGVFGLTVKYLCRSKTDDSVILLSFEEDSNRAFERHYRLYELFRTRKEAQDVFNIIIRLYDSVVDHFKKRD